MMGYGAELESEAVSCGEEAGVGVADEFEHSCQLSVVSYQLSVISKS